MKKLIIFLSLALLFSCKKDNTSVTDTLKKRIVTIEDFLIPAAPTGETKYVADSIVEYYENKRIVNREFYTRESLDDEFIGDFRNYNYNAQGLLSEVQYYNDIGLEDDYRLRVYSYDNEGKIKEIDSNKFGASNLSEGTGHITISYDYTPDTITKTTIDLINNDTEPITRVYVVYGNIDSISRPNLFTFNFDAQNDLTSRTCLDCDSLSINWYYEYQSDRVPLIENCFGSKLNTFLIGQPYTYHDFEVSDKYLTRSSYNYPNILRNGNWRDYEYVFNENGRLEEVVVGGSYSFGHAIRYYYE